MRTVNHAEGERLRKAKEDRKKKKQRKLQVCQRGEDTNSDDDDADDEVALTDIDLSLQASGPFPLHGGEGTSGELMEMGHTIGLP